MAEPREQVCANGSNGNLSCNAPHINSIRTVSPVLLSEPGTVSFHKWSKGTASDSKDNSYGRKNSWRTDSQYGWTYQFGWTGLSHPSPSLLSMSGPKITRYSK